MSASDNTNYFKENSLRDDHTKSDSRLHFRQSSPGDPLFHNLKEKKKNVFNPNETLFPDILYSNPNSSSTTRQHYNDTPGICQPTKNVLNRNAQKPSSLVASSLPVYDTSQCRGFRGMEGFVEEVKPVEDKLSTLLASCKTSNTGLTTKPSEASVKSQMLHASKNESQGYSQPFQQSVEEKSMIAPGTESSKGIAPLTLTCLTKNVIEHARDLHTLAQNAASCFFNPNTTSSVNSLCLGSGKENFSSRMSLNEQVDVETRNNALLKITWETLQYPSRNQNVNGKDQKLHWGTDSSKESLVLNEIPLGWKTERMTLNADWIVIKCFFCWYVYAAKALPMSKYTFIGATSHSLVNKYEKQLDSISGNATVKETPTDADTHPEENYKRLPFETILYCFDSTVAFWGATLEILGTLLVTNYRFVFVPSLKQNTWTVNLGIQWMHLTNFWELPLGVISRINKLTISTKDISRFLTLCHNGNGNTAAQFQGDTTGADGNEKSESNLFLEGLHVEISTKDMRHVRFLLTNLTDKKKVWQLLNQIIFPYSVYNLYAMSFPRNIDFTRDPSDFESSLPFVYNMQKEWDRFLKFPHTHWLQVSSINKSFSVCGTYPEYVIVPKALSNDMISKVAMFRCKQRFPYLSWASSTSPATLWRCSQPKSMFQRCIEDELFFKTLLSSCASSRSNELKPLLILDARPLINAVVNKASGAGFENTSTNYKGCRIEFASIDNIHHLRIAWKKMLLAVDSFVTSLYSVPCFTSLCDTTYHSFNEKNTTDINPLLCCPFCQSDIPWTDPPKTLTYNPSESLWMYSSCINSNLTSQEVSHPFQSAFLQKLGQSLWYEYVQKILRACNYATSQLCQGEAVVIHCSDGWDRTVQLTSLVMLCMDSYYRTMKGFFILIEQEFLHGGHQFRTRCGHPGRLINPFEYKNSFNCTKQNMNNLSEAFKEQIQLSDIKYGSTQWKHEQAPVFVQWLDCVYQLINQFPSCFEFNTALLDILAAEVYNCYYGTFLFDNEQERVYTRVKQRSKCLWNSLLSAKHNLLQPKYTNKNDHLILRPNVHDTKFWYSYWFRYHPCGFNYLVQSSIQLF